MLRTHSEGEYIVQPNHSFLMFKKLDLILLNHDRTFLRVVKIPTVIRDKANFICVYVII